MALTQVEKPIFTSPNGAGESEQKPVRLPFWKDYFKWEANLIVAGRTINKGWVVPQPLGIALLVVMLGGVGSLYWRLTDRVDAIGDKQAAEMQAQREMLIRLDQRLIDKNENDKEDIERLEKRFQNTDAVQTVMNRDIQTLKIKGGFK